MNTGIPYRIGETYQRDCGTRCTCRAGGQTDCMSVPCDFNGPTCYANGDPHYRTFDGLPYDYQGGCQYAHVERCTNSKFSIKTRHVPCPRPQFTCISEVTVEAPGVTIIMERGDPIIPVSIDGQMASGTDIILYEVNGVEVRRVGTSIHLFFKHNRN